MVRRGLTWVQGAAIRFARLDRLATPWSANPVIRAALCTWLGLLGLGAVLVATGSELDPVGLVLFVTLGPLAVIWWFVAVLAKVPRVRRSAAFVQDVDAR